MPTPALHDDTSAPETSHLRDETPSAPAARRRGAGLLFATALGALGGGGAVWLHGHDHGDNEHRQDVGAPGRGVSASNGTTTAREMPKKPLYQCPMHPTVTSDHPGTCPICGMKLVEVTPAAEPSKDKDNAKTGGVEGLAAVTIDPARQQMIGLRTSPVSRGPISDAWRTVGKVEVDPTRVRRVNVKVDGYVERTFVGFVGERVRKGQPLLSLYSPSLVAAESEYLLAVRTRQRLAAAGGPGAGPGEASVGPGDDLVKSARRKLELWDVPEAELARLERTGEVAKTLTLNSPIGGVVTAKNIVEGSRINPGDTPYEITDLSMVWVMADAYETDLARARVGAAARMTVKSLPGITYAGRVQFVDPVVDPKTRTIKVHLHFPNKNGDLKPDMYGEVELEGKSSEGLRIPSDALIHAGTKDIVFVSLGDGKFAPREVRTGPQGTAGTGLTQILSGLSEGEEVVSRANFLIDSESRLRASLATIGAK